MKSSHTRFGFVYRIFPNLEILSENKSYLYLRGGASVHTAPCLFTYTQDATTVHHDTTPSCTSVDFWALSLLLQNSYWTTHTFNQPLKTVRKKYWSSVFILFHSTKETGKNTFLQHPSVWCNLNSQYMFLQMKYELRTKLQDFTSCNKKDFIFLSFIQAKVY